MTSPLLDPVRIGPYTLRNRVVMAPLTRCRSGQPGNVPTELNARYYRQRAEAGLIVSEASQICPQGQGYAWTPGIHTPEQVAGWRLVSDAVHEAGGCIFLQLWHVGRISHPCYQPDGALPLAPSAITPSGQAFVLDEQGRPGWAPFVTPRALASEELPSIVKQYAAAARNALAAGFDGVEVHGANGYLLDQFLQSNTNQRQDSYGGSAANRARLLLEVIEAVSEVWGAGRVGVRLSPLGTFNDMADADPMETFGYIAGQLDGCSLAYLHLVDPTYGGHAGPEQADPRAAAIMALIRERFRGPLIVCGGYDQPHAETALAQGRADLVAFGKPFIANPDLVERFRRHAPLNTPDPDAFYGGGEAGYTDYPRLEA